MKAIGYVRVSTNEQAKEGISLRHQEEKVKAYAALHEMELVDIVVDEGLSAKTLSGRPGAMRIIDQCLAGEVEAVIVYKLDRMFRNAQEALDVSTKLNKSGVALHSVTEKIDTQSAMGKFFFTIMAACAEMERNLVSERTRDALQHKKRSGEVYNHAPYGYDVVEGKLVDNEYEQGIIKRIKSLREEEVSLQGIADKLNTDNITTKKGKKWEASTVRNVLKFKA